MNIPKGINNLKDINNDLAKNEENKEDIYEEMDKENLEIKLIKNGKKSKKVKKTKFFKFILFTSIIALIILSFYLFYQRKQSINNYQFEINLKLNNTIDYIQNKIRNYKAHSDFKAYSLSEFPSGNFIVHDDVLMIIYDNKLNELQQIYPFNADLLDKKFPKIIRIRVKDDNNFMISTTEGNIKLYTKKGKDFILKDEIKDYNISIILFDAIKETLFALSNNSLILFKDNKNGKYYLANNISLSDLKNYNLLMRKVHDDMLLLEDKNILIVKQYNDIKFYDMSNNCKLIYIFKDKDIISIERFGEDKLLVIGNYNILKIISIYENKIFNKLKTYFELTDVKYIKEKDVIILGGAYEISDRHMRLCQSYIQILKGDNLELIQNIREDKYYTIYGINVLKNGNIAIYHGDVLQFWKLEKK